jgi:hypothetical protein
MQLHRDQLALGVCLGGIVLGVLIGLLGRLVGLNFFGAGYTVFAAFQVVAIVLGVLCRESTIGKATAIASSVLLVASLLFVT